MIGWGSATMIDGKGHLLTNNHVVDNGFGGTLDGFVVCVIVFVILYVFMFACVCRKPFC